MSGHEFSKQKLTLAFSLHFNYKRNHHQALIHLILNMTSPKIVLVTGANSGIGYETVKAFYESPNLYHVVLTSRSLQNGIAAMEKIKTEVPASSNTIQVAALDLTSDDSINKAFETVKSTNTKIDALINNAGKHPGAGFWSCLSLQGS